MDQEIVRNTSFDIYAIIIKIFMTEHHHKIMVYYNTAVYGGNEYGKFGHLYVFFLNFFVALNDAIEVHIFREFIFMPLSQTMIHCSM